MGDDCAAHDVNLGVKQVLHITANKFRKAVEADSSLSRIQPPSVRGRKDLLQAIGLVTLNSAELKQRCSAVSDKSRGP